MLDRRDRSGGETVKRPLHGIAYGTGRTGGLLTGVYKVALRQSWCLQRCAHVDVVCVKRGLARAVFWFPQNIFST